MKKVIIGVVSLLALAIAAVLVYRNQTASTIKGELTDFAVTDTAAISRINLKDESGETIDLRRQPNGEWTVNEHYKARPDAVRNLLYTISKVSVKTPVSQQSMQTVLKNIIASHVLVDIYQGGNKPVKSYYVGGATQSHTGTNMMMKSSSRPFVMHIEGFHGFLTPRYFTNLNEWRHRGVFEYNPDEIRSVEVRYPGTPDNDFRIERPDAGDPYLVFSGREMQPVGHTDELMLSGYLSGYKMIHFESFEETKEETFIDSVKVSVPMFTIELTTTGGDERIVHGYRKPMKGYDMEDNPIDYDIDRLYIWIDSSEFTVAQYVIFDKLTKGTGFLKRR